MKPPVYTIRNTKNKKAWPANSGEAMLYIYKPFPENARPYMVYDANGKRMNYLELLTIALQYKNRMSSC